MSSSPPFQLQPGDFDSASTAPRDEATMRDAESVARLNLLFEASPLAIFANDADGRITLWNAAATQVFGWTAAQALGRYVPLVQESARAEADNLRAMIMAANVPQRFEVVRRRSDGTPVNVMMHAAPLRDGMGHVIGSIAFAEDITRRKQDEARIRHMAQHDLLTGLPNRDLLLDRAQWMLQQADPAHEQVALVVLDLDNFKGVNNTLGHATGDGLLREVALKLQAALGPHDTLARQGGDEFIILTRRTAGEAQAGQVTRTLQQAASGTIRMGRAEVTVTASMGVAIHPDDGRDAESLLRNATIAMQHGKEFGRGSVQFFSAALNEQVNARMALERDLREALARGELRVHYQPQILLRDRSVRGAEALVRWTHPERGPVSPATFIPIAEEAGMIADIGAYVLAESAGQLARWRAAGHALPRLAVNLSILELTRGLLASTTRILRDTGADPAALGFEITEGRLMDGSDESIAVLRQLHALGISVALDDFGTGFSSLSRLRRLPIDLLKIDRSFVSGVDAELVDAAIVRAIVDMAHSLGLLVIAEGVETAAQAEVLAGIGCDEAQGFLFGAALPADEFEARFLAPPAN